MLKPGDRFRCVLHSGEIALADGTIMFLVVFVIWRAKSGAYDMLMVNKYFRQNGSTNEILMSRKDIPAVEIDQFTSTIYSTFALGLNLKSGTEIEWDELDLGGVSGRDEQLQRNRSWGKFRNIKVRN